MPKKSLIASCLILLAACGDGGTTTPDAAVLDAHVVDSGEELDAAADLGTDADAATGDASDADVTADASPDAETGDAGSECGDYIDLTPYIVKCGGEFEYAWEWVRVEGTTEECPPYYTLLGGTYASLEEAMTNKGCDDSCTYRPGISVSAAYCLADCTSIRRYGWITFEADGTECPTLYELPGGLFTSVEDWFAQEVDDECAAGYASCFED